MNRMKKARYKVKKLNRTAAGRKYHSTLRSRFRFGHVESLGLVELPAIRNLSVESMISSIDAAMAHEGLPLSKENKQMMRACMCGKVSIQDAKAAMLAKHSRTGSARNI